MPEVLEPDTLEAQVASGFLPLPFQPDSGQVASGPQPADCTCGVLHPAGLPKDPLTHRVLKGHSHKQHGRKWGTRNFKTILAEAERPLAEAYVRYAKRGSAPLLQDARKVHAPIDSDKSGRVADAPQLLTLLAKHLTLIQVNAPTLRMVDSVAEQPVSSLTPPTGSTSAGTGGEARPPTPPLG